MLHKNFTADATVEAASRADKAAFAVEGNFGGGTLKLQGRVRGGEGTWFDITDASWTATATGILDITKDWDVRADLAGATSPDVTISLSATTA